MLPLPPHDRMPDQVAHRMVEDRLCSYRGAARGGVRESSCVREPGLCATASGPRVVTAVGPRWIVLALAGGVRAAPDADDAVVPCAAAADPGTAGTVRAAVAKTVVEAVSNLRIGLSSCHAR